MHCLGDREKADVILLVIVVLTGICMCRYKYLQGEIPCSTVWPSSWMWAVVGSFQPSVLHPWCYDLDAKSLAMACFPVIL